MPTGERFLNECFEEASFEPVENPNLGDVQGVSLWAIEPTIDTAIASVSRGINKEVSSIVGKIEWVSVTVDVNRYSSQLEIRGFIALFAGRPRGKNFGEPGLEVDIKFGLNPPGKDKFFCSSLELPGLCRALSLSAGYSSAELCLKMGRCGKASDDIQRSRESDLLGPFTSPIGQPGKVTVEGCMTEEILAWAKKVNENGPTSSKVVQEITSNLLARSNELIKCESWQQAHDEALYCIGLIDIALKYGTYYTDLGNHLKRTTLRGLSNMILARLKLNDAEGAFNKVMQIEDHLPILRGEADHSTASMRIGMVNAKLGNNRVAMDYFFYAYRYPPRDSQLTKELQAFQQGMKEKKDATAHEEHMVKVIQAMLDVAEQFRGTARR